MKICRYGDDRLGIVQDGRIYDVTDIQEIIRVSFPYNFEGDPVIAMLKEWTREVELAGRPSIALADAQLLAPVARPTKLMAAPSNYRAHIDETLKDPGIRQVARSIDIGEAGIFLKANSSLAGPAQGIVRRFPDRRTDQEGELVIVIGKKGSNIPRERALEHVAGYCLGLDMTLRGKEDRSFRKSIDGYSVAGPYLVTADEIAEPGNLSFEVAVNGEQRQDVNTRNLIYDIPRLIEFASSFYTLHPGDLFFTGTDQGVGPVEPGDTITLSSALLGGFSVKVGHDEG